MIRSLLKLSLLAGAILLVSLAAAVVAFQRIVVIEKESVRHEQDQRAATQIAAEVARFIAAQQALLTGLARHPVAEQQLARMGNDRSARLPQALPVPATLEGAEVYAIPPDVDRLEPVGLGNACLMLLYRIRRADVPFMVEYHGQQATNRHIDVLYAIPAPADDPAGFLLLRVPARHIEAILAPSAPPAGALMLTQLDVTATVSTIAKFGDAAPGAARISEPIANAPWEIVMWTASEPAPAWAGGRALVPTIVLMAALFVPLVTLVAVLYRINRATRHDIKSLLRIFEDIRQGNMRVDYPLVLAEFREAFDTLKNSGRQIVKQHQHFRQMGLVDHLSQLYNRRAFEERLEHLFNLRAARGPSSVLIIDVDHFKSVNDRFGHDAGDVLIMAFSRALKKLVRHSDFVARLGGDEFCVIFSYTPIDQAVPLVRRLREQLPAAIRLTDDYEHQMRWTGGLSAIAKEDTKMQQVLWRADQALLKAKESGRNQTLVYHPLEGLLEHNI